MLTDTSLTSPDAPDFHGIGRRFLLCVLLCLAGLAAVLFYSHLTEEPAYWPAVGIGTAVASLGVIGALRFFGFGWQSAPFAYGIFLWMFHFPMTLLVNLMPELWTRLPSHIYRWTQYASWYDASAYSLLCVIVFAIGCGLASLRGGQREDRADQPDKVKFRIGLATALGGLAWLYFMMIREGGFDLFGSSYVDLYNTAFASVFSLAIFVVSVGCFLALLTAPRNLAWLPVLLQVAGSLPVLLTGSRQFALIGPFVLAVVAARRGLRFGVLRAALSGVVILWLISYVGETRNHGVLGGGADTQQVGPVNALVEMGGSLQTTSLALDWIQNGDAYLLGGGYWLPFERALGLVLPIRSDLAVDPRAMNIVLTTRTSGLGGSAIAESYYNFSVFGALFFLVLGFLLARMELNASSPNSAAMMAVVLYAFIFQARNWFISVPSLILLGSIPIVACVVLEFFARRKREREGAGEGFESAVPARTWLAGGRP